MNAKETQAQTGETQTGETQAQAQTKEEKELELTKDYYAHRLPRSYYSPTGFTQFFIRLNPWFEDVTDIYAFFNPEDAYRDDYNQICAKINALILWRNDLWSMFYLQCCNKSSRHGSKDNFHKQRSSGISCI